ncbi:hypothetical protein M3147_08500 [Agromyces mediolanus]|uniref:hypothetical protein n=1 Tax=Agromyces mediolanus TaxID=41986 RepID=UPI00204233B8|nr:hypothetical protein [Agromyces mediolanus]MCM3657289.1 hypothetical protein [Agromyces mediolanus]
MRAFAANRGATGGEATAQSIRADLYSLSPGKTTGYVVNSEKELKALFLRWTQGARKEGVVEGPKYKIEQYRLPDGTRLQWRHGSKSGGGTIEFTLPGTKIQEKVHVE